MGRARQQPGETGRRNNRAIDSSDANPEGAMPAGSENAMNLALLAAAATGIQVGAATVATRFVVGEIAPLTLALLRYAIGAACLVPLAIALARRAPVHGALNAGRPRPRSAVVRDWCVMALLGIGQFGVLIAALNYGLQTVDAARAAMIFSLFPLLTLVLSSLLGQERMHARLLTGVAMAVAGVMVALAPKIAATRSDAWIGELAVLASAAIGATCSVLYRPYLRQYPVVQVSAYAMLASVVFLAVAALSESWPSALAGIRPAAWAVVVFIGLSSAVGYWLWLYALRHETATRVTVFLALNPLTAAALGHGLLNEPLDGSIVLAVAMISAGLWFATRARVPGAAR